jgi:subtilisin family serine protease
MITSRLLILLLVCLGVCVDVCAAKIEPSVQQQMAQNQTVRVIVLFKSPPALLQSDAQRLGHIKQTADGLLRDLNIGEPNRRFNWIPALAVTVDADLLDRLANHPDVLTIGIDAPGSGHLAESAPLANMTPLYSNGMNGRGITVAVVDSGIDTDHADFDGRIIDQQCFCAGVAGAVGCCPDGSDTMTGLGAAEDDHGHGTNVTGIIAGDGSVALRGAVPAADIVAVKVLDANNSFCCVSDVAAGFDWIRTNHSNIAVVNASLGTFALSSTSCDADPAPSFMVLLAQATQNLTNNGTMVVVSSGNQRSATSVASPACANSAITVGAVWDAPRAELTFLNCTQTPATDLATCFTNSNNLVDLYAPGAFVTSAGLGGGTSSFGGTSQAAPMTAGCAALLIAQYPEASLSEIEAALEASPNRITDPKNNLEFPRLNCAAALSQFPNLFVDGFEAN